MTENPRMRMPAETAEVMITRIVSAHAISSPGISCPCWVCKSARLGGEYAPDDDYMTPEALADYPVPLTGWGEDSLHRVSAVEIVDDSAVRFPNLLGVFMREFPIVVGNVHRTGQARTVRYHGEDFTIRPET